MSQSFFVCNSRTILSIRFKSSSQADKILIVVYVYACEELSGEVTYG